MAFALRAAPLCHSVPADWSGFGNRAGIGKQTRLRGPYDRRPLPHASAAAAQPVSQVRLPNGRFQVAAHLRTMCMAPSTQPLAPARPGLARKPRSGRIDQEQRWRQAAADHRVHA